MEDVFLGIGSNLGDREENLAQARDSIEAFVRIEAVSPVYETNAWGFEDQPAFLNQVIHIKTSLTPQALLRRIKRIEKDLGRKKSFRWGPRLIDIDILFFADYIIESASLTIPHKELHKRAFVLVPLADIAPDFVHPVFNQTVSALRDTLADLEGIRLWKSS
ncbi:MAG TPA: 2-amino-4-hydroxy-6-hydroxymethyldihydropteridine diphosphokinase [Anaerolineaceae bacterium]|nr:2-amino-4-hydroxy-6-hydroxymethyldihydropteridine diphosphokinase [Anaerolineaceae bacterium]